MILIFIFFYFENANIVKFSIYVYASAPLAGDRGATVWAKGGGVKAVAVDCVDVPFDKGVAAVWTEGVFSIAFFSVADVDEFQPLTIGD